MHGVQTGRHRSSAGPRCLAVKYYSCYSTFAILSKRVWEGEEDKQDRHNIYIHKVIAYSYTLPIVCFIWGGVSQVPTINMCKSGRFKLDDYPIYVLWSVAEF